MSRTGERHVPGARPPRRWGFTLIELLVVVAILVLLLAILSPTARRSRELARRVVCLTNLHHIGAAVGTYYAEFRVYPRPAMSIYNDWFPWMIPGELWLRSGGSAEMWTCPSKPPADREVVESTALGPWYDRNWPGDYGFKDASLSEYAYVGNLTGLNDGRTGGPPYGPDVDASAKGFDGERAMVTEYVAMVTPIAGGYEEAYFPHRYFAGFMTRQEAYRSCDGINTVYGDGSGHWKPVNSLPADFNPALAITRFHEHSRSFQNDQPFWHNWFWPAVGQ